MGLPLVQTLAQVQSQFHTDAALRLAVTAGDYAGDCGPAGRREMVPSALDLAP